MIAVDSSLSLRFPTDRCCNCDARTTLEGIDVEVPLDLVSLEAEHWALVVQPTFCRLCRNTARRRKPTMRERIVLGALASLGLVALFAYVAAALSAEVNPLLLIGAAIGSAVALAVYFERLVKPGSRDQSSFWAPVSVGYRAKERSEEAIRHLAFDFSSRPYAIAFQRLNSAAVASGALAVTLAGKPVAWVGGP